LVIQLTRSDDMAATIARYWLWTAALVTAAAFAAVLTGATRYPTLGFVAQDLPVLVTITAVAILGRRLARPTRLARSTDFARTIAMLVAVVVLVGLVGHRFVFHNYALSMDEFWSLFDGQIFRAGQLVAPVAAPFREFLPALTTSFRLPVAENAGWVSLYLPVNAALLALPGGATWVPPFLAGVAVVLVAAIARRLVPVRRDTALVAALLLASSPQLIVTAMTPYAMTAHLAFNLLWLWLVLRDRPSSHVAAAIVAWLATGLHQLIFNPLFAAPFVLSMWRERRWGVAAFHSLAYLAIGLFWINWQPIALGSEGLASPGAGPRLLLATLHELVATFSFAGLGLMAQNLLRFIVWQNPLTVVLLVLGATAALRASGVRRDLLLGIVLTLLVMTILMPAQGYGWGYRYLHGLLGNIALLAAMTWDELAGTDEARRAHARWLVKASAGFALLVLLPFHCWHAERLVAPYARVSARLNKVDADYVLVDPGKTAHGTDLARNDPWLRNRPKILDLEPLEAPQIRRLCATGSVAVFGVNDAIAAGLPQLSAVSPPERVENRRLLSALGCDHRHIDGRG
jgi:hypothetical protein